MEAEELVKACVASGIQDPFCALALFKARMLSDELLDSSGQLIKALPKLDGHVSGAISFLKKNRHALAPFSLPVCGAWVEELICHSLQMPKGSKLTVRDVRRAVLSAMLTPLRQTVGSCFASAPAIMIQDEQHENFLADLLELMTKGTLTRIVSGEELSVPISPSFGHGDLNRIANEHAPGLKQPNLPKIRTNETVLAYLDRSSDPEGAKAYFKSITDHALLKVWEFSLASFSDVKNDFSKWNLFSSLGFDMSEQGGIGELLAQKLNEEISAADDALEKHREEAIVTQERVRMIQTLMKSVDSREKAHRLKNELHVHLHHLRACEDLYEKAHGEGERLKELFTYLLDQYAKLFPQFFQEIYDPEMFDAPNAQYEDSPAGFRLVYKHGRRDPSLWTLIQDEKEYVESLCDFFVMSEAYLQGDKDEQSRLTTAIIHHVQTEEFITSAKKRVAKMHKKAGVDEHVKKQKKPWSYVSGGSMHTLLRSYYARESTITEEKYAPESAFDLITFLIDLLKKLPPSVTKHKTLLMHSPTHAFLLKPYLSLFYEGWNDSGFTYTWLRDLIITPGQAFYDEMTLSREEQTFILQSLRVDVPVSPSSISIPEFRDLLPLPEEIADGALRTLITEAKNHLHTTPQNQKLKTPPGLVFADTNWSGYYFAILYNPASKEAELWRTDIDGMKGFPMTAWKGLMQKEWALFTNPKEYTSIMKIQPHDKKV